MSKNKPIKPTTTSTPSTPSTAMNSTPSTPTTVRYQPQPPKRGVHAETKWGDKGNLGTLQALHAACTENNGSLTDAQAMAVCASLNHKGFWKYALRNRWFVPVATATAEQKAA